MDAPEYWWRDIAEVVSEGIECYMPFWDNPQLGPKPNHVHWIHTCGHFRYILGQHKDSYICKEWHTPMYCDHGTSLNTAIQLAIQKGFKVVYLLGKPRKLVCGVIFTELIIGELLNF